MYIFFIKAEVRKKVEYLNIKSSESIWDLYRDTQLRWVWHMVEMGKERTLFRTLTCDLSGKRPEGRPRCWRMRRAARLGRIQGSGWHDFGLSSPVRPVSYLVTEAFKCEVEGVEYTDRLVLLIYSFQMNDDFNLINSYMKWTTWTY